MKAIRIHLFALIIIFGFFFTACNMNGNEWEQVESINELAGLWRGSFTVKVPASGDYNLLYSMIFNVPIPQTSVFYENYELEYEKYSDVISIRAKMVFDQLLDDTVKMNTGYTKDSLWDNLVSFYEPTMSLFNVTIGKYYTIQEINNPLNYINFSYLYLNNDKTQLKLFFRVDENTLQEVILYRI